MLDHILLGTSDLDAGIGLLRRHTGVKATFGGAHPGRGTHNALLSLGERRYLEIIAPDPQQAVSTDPLALRLRKFSEPRLVGWAAHPGALGTFAETLRERNIGFDGPKQGSRKRLDGGLLRWQTLNLRDDAAGLLPFFIEWDPGSPHPAADSPQGLRIVRFELATPTPEALNRTAELLSLDAPVVKADEPQIRASFAGPKGNLDLTS
jgi:glyoxalase-like protein